MLKTEDIVASFKRAIRPSSRLVVIHSNLGSLGLMEDPPHQILDALDQALPEQATLAIPTFTFSFCRSGRYHHRESPSEVGLLGETFRKRPGVVRSSHPIYSFAVRGPLANRLPETLGPTTWGSETFFGMMEEWDADILMLGCDWQYCTLFHRAEELAQVPYRYYKTFPGQADFGGGPKPVGARFFVRHLDLPAENSFAPYAEALRRQGKIRSVPLGRGRIEAASAREIVSTGRELLEKDPLLLIEQPSPLRSALSKDRIAVLGSTNLSIFSEILRNEAEKLIPGGVRIHVPPFDQYRRQLVQQESDLLQFDPQWILFLDRAEDLLGPLVQDPLALPPDTVQIEKAVQERLTPYVEAIRLAREKTKARILVLDFDLPPHSPLFLSDQEAVPGQTKIVEIANDFLKKECEGMHDLWLIDFSRIASSFGRIPSRDDRYWLLGRIPFSRNFSITLSRRLLGAILSLKGKTARVLVVDLDNTLWGGVIGDDGLEGIRLGGDYPGNAYAAFQRALLAVSRRGIPLAICSKNTEEIALQAVREHPEMILREKDFITRRINWDDKAANLEEIAKELGLGLDSLCFLDDNPQEREWVRRNLPEVIVPELPKDPADYASFLFELSCLEVLRVTREDHQRVRQYQKRSEIEKKRRQFQSVEDFYRDLGMTLYLETYGPAHQSRSLQLLAKTNQFNTTTRRYTEKDLAHLLTTGASLWPIGLQDRCSEKEIIGLAIVRWHHPLQNEALIDSFLLSCRVLGRSVETGVLGFVAEEARKRGIRNLRGQILATQKNLPVRDLYLRHGFQAVGEGEFSLELSKNHLSVPDWFQLKRPE